MIQTKYNLLKTAGKTAKENNLTVIKKDKKTYLYDFSRLDIQELADYKQILIDQIVKDTNILNTDTFVNGYIDSFAGISGMVYINPLKVYDSMGKVKYIIMDIGALNIGINERSNIYHEWNATTEIKEKYYNVHCIEEIEIA